MKILALALILSVAILACKNKKMQTEEIPFKILFGSDSNGNSEIYLMDANGVNKCNISNHSANDGGAQISPEGDYIYFISDRVSSEPAIFRMKTDATDVSNLTKGIGPLGGFCLSKDGKKIVFQVGEKTNDNRPINSIFIVDSNGQNLKRLTSNWNCENPSISPSGDKIAFDGWRDGFNNIFTMNIDGSNLKNLTNDYGYLNHMPFFSNNGASIFFNSFVEGSYIIHRLDLSNGRITKISNDYAFIRSQSQIAANDSLIIYATQDASPFNKFLYFLNGLFESNIFNIIFRLDIYLCNPFTHERTTAGQFPMRSLNHHPVPYFAPDGKHVLITLNIIDDPYSQEFVGDIFLLDLSNLQLTNLTQNEQTSDWIYAVF